LPGHAIARAPVVDAPAATAASIGAQNPEVIALSVHLVERVPVRARGLAWTPRERFAEIEQLELLVVSHLETYRRLER